MVGRLLRLGEGNTSGNPAALGQRRSRGPVRRSDRWHLPQRGGQRGNGKGWRTGKHRRHLPKSRSAGLDREAGCDGSGLHRTGSSKRPILGLGGDVKSGGAFEGDVVVHAIVIVPPFANTRCGEPPNKDYVVLGKLLLIKLEVDNKTETIPIAFLGTTVTICKPTNGIAYGPRPGEGRREMRKGIDVLAQNLGGGLPVVECKPDSNLLLESDVANKNRPVESSRSGPRKGQTLDVDIGVGIRGVGEWRGFVGIDCGQALRGLGRWSWRLREGIR
jgi:hypothetical protein